jgi:hypothetical protein
MFQTALGTNAAYRVFWLQGCGDVSSIPKPCRAPLLRVLHLILIAFCPNKYEHAKEVRLLLLCRVVMRSEWHMQAAPIGSNDVVILGRSDNPNR